MRPEYLRKLGYLFAVMGAATIPMGYVLSWGYLWLLCHRNGGVVTQPFPEWGIIIVWSVILAGFFFIVAIAFLRISRKANSTSAEAELGKAGKALRDDVESTDKEFGQQ